MGDESTDSVIIQAEWMQKTNKASSSCDYIRSMEHRAALETTELYRDYQNAVNTDATSNMVPDEGQEEDLTSRKLKDLPEELLAKCNVTSLFLDFNIIEQLPDNIDQLQRLKYLSLIGNSLETIPVGIGNMSAIEELHLNENCLTHLPDEICRLKHLKVLKLTGNGLEMLPDEFGELSDLAILHCDENSLKKLPKTFGCLEKLVELEMGFNSIENLSEGFGMLKSLQVLNLSNNKLECLPDSFGNLPSLRTIDLSTNKLKSLPNACKSCETLEKMYLESNLLETLPDWVAQLSNIKEFSVKDNQLQNQPIPDEFPTRCRKLRHLDLSGNFMSRLPETMGALQEVEFIHLGSVIGELERRNFQNGNWLTCMPVSMCSLTKLRELHMDENQISELPDNFGDLVSLEFLDLGQNLLSTLPDSFGQLRSLRICMLSKNHLMWLPSNFGELSSLEDLRLDDNELAELPQSFSKLTQLKTLDLFSNRLREIPTALQCLTNLVRLDIEANDFPIPLTEIPMIMPRSKYAERDPNLKDNWRGRTRQDISSLDDKIIKIAPGTKCEDFEPPPPDLPYNFLISAMRQSTSVWKSHADTSEGRRRSRKTGARFTRHHYDSSPDSDEEDDDERGPGQLWPQDDSGTDYDNEAGSDDEFEPPILVQEKPWSGSMQSPQKSPQVEVTAMLEETENWDDEIEANTSQYDSPQIVYTHPTKIYYPPIENGQFTFTPSDLHPPAYVKRPEDYRTENDQFEDCDDDDTELRCIDPVF